MAALKRGVRVPPAQKAVTEDFHFALAPLRQSTRCVRPTIAEGRVRSRSRMN